jgi:hypothetical protein
VHRRGAGFQQVHLHRFQALDAPCRQQQPRAFASKGSRARSANAGAGSGDEDPTIFQAVCAHICYRILDSPTTMRMTVRTSGRIASTTRTAAPRGRTILFFAFLMAGLIFLLCLRLGFARYAFTCFLWERAEGTVVTTFRTTDPTIQFVGQDGSLHSFSEDYFLLCGRRSLCFRRSFSPGEVVPVVYDPAAPNRAFVRDFALYSTIFEWFVEAFFLLVITTLMLNLVRGGSGNIAIQFGSRPIDE